MTESPNSRTEQRSVCRSRNVNQGNKKSHSINGSIHEKFNRESETIARRQVGKHMGSELHKSNWKTSRLTSQLGPKWHKAPTSHSSACKTYKRKGDFGLIKSAVTQQCNRYTKKLQRPLANTEHFSSNAMQHGSSFLEQAVSHLTVCYESLERCSSILHWFSTFIKH